MSENVSPLDQIREFRDSWTKPRLQALVDAGYTNDEIRSPEIRAQIKTATSKAVVAQFGPGTEMNLDHQDLSYALNSLGMGDYVFGPLPERYASMEEAAAMVAAERERERPYQTPEAMRQLQMFAGNPQAAASFTYPRSTTEMRAMPAKIGTALRQISWLPTYDKRAEKNPEVFEAAMRYSIPGYELPGVKRLEQAGVYPWAADIVMETTLDPFTWLDPGVGDLGRVALGVGTAAVGAAATRVGWAMTRRGAVQSGADLADNVVRVAERFADVSAKARQGLLEADEITGIAQQAARDPEGGRRAKALEKFSSLLEKHRGGVAEGRLEADGRFLGIVKSLLDDEAPGTSQIAEELLDLRTSLVDNPIELASWQAKAEKALKGSLDVDRMRVLSRSDITESFLNRTTGEIVEVEAGLVSRFVSNPDDFIINNRWKKTAEGHAVRKLLNDNDPLSAVAHFEELIPVGNTKLFRDVAAGLIEAEGLESLAKRIKLPLASKLIKLAPMGERLADTPLFKPMVRQEIAQTAEREAWRLRFHDALGGRVAHLGNALMEQIVTGGSGFKLTKRSILARRNRSALSPMRFIEKLGEGKARDFNDALAWQLGDQVTRDAILAKRGADGLERPVVTSEVAEAAANVERLFDDLGNEAVKLGLVDPRTLVKNYLPRVYAQMQNGVSATEAVKMLRAELGGIAKEADPFFSMVRHGEDPAGLITDVPRLYEMYTSTLMRHKYLKPFVQDVLDTVQSPKYPMDAADRMLTMDYLHHMLGGTSTFQAAYQKTMRMQLRNAQELARDPDMARRLLDDRIAQLARDEGAERAIDYWTRQLTDLFYTHFMGGKLGLGLRNYTQLALAAPAVGGGRTSFKHFTNGLRRVRTDKALYARYMESAKKWNWHGEFYEFADNAFEQVGFARKPDILPRGYKKALLGWFQLTDMHLRTASWGAGYDYAEGLVRSASKGKTPKWKSRTRQFDKAERAYLDRAFREGRFEDFKTAYADAVVNNSQWLYNARNRPHWAQTQANAILGAMMVFMTWPLNYGTALARATESGMTKMAPAALRNAKAIEMGLRWLAPAIGLGIAMEYGGKLGPIGGMGNWIFPEYGPPDEKVVVPFPPLKNLSPVGTLLNPDQGPTETFPALGAWAAVHGLFKAGQAAYRDEDPNLMARAIHQVPQAIPVTPGGWQPAMQALGESLGIEPDPDFRDGIYDMVLGALLQMRDDDSVEAAIRRSQALPKRPDDQERRMWPFEPTD